VATLTLHCITAMPTTTRPGDWSPERTARLARAMFPIVFGRPAPAPASARAANVVRLADYRRPAPPCPE
jgi:hypothetical protein